MKISKRGLAIFQKIHEIYETLKLENFVPHLYFSPNFLMDFCSDGHEWSGQI